MIGVFVFSVINGFMTYALSVFPEFTGFGFADDAFDWIVSHVSSYGVFWPFADTFFCIGSLIAVIGAIWIMDIAIFVTNAITLRGLKK